MPEHVPVAELDPGIVALVDQIRANHPGLIVGVQSPTVEERDDLDVTGDHREIVIGPVGSESYVIPLHDNNDATGFEVWRVGVVDMPGAGELLDSHTNLHAAVDAAVAAATQPPETPEPTPADSGPGPGPTAVSNVWRSDMTAAAEVQAQVRAAAEPGNDAIEPGQLRDEEVALLEQVDPGTADTLRGARAVGSRAAGGRADWVHRRPERAAPPAAGRGRGRSVDGSD